MVDSNIPEEFKKQTVLFLDELITQFPLDGNLVVLRIFIKDQISSTELLEKFTDIINKDDKKLKKMVSSRNESFFLENNIFGTSPGIDEAHFKKLWSSSTLDADDKEVIWNWIDSFVYLSDKTNLCEPT